MTVDLGQPDPSLGPAGAPLPPFGNRTVRDAAQLRAEMERIQLRLEQAAHATFKRATAELLAKLVFANPVGNPDLWKHSRSGYVGGHSRRNWQIVTLPGAAQDKVGGPPIDPYAAAAGIQLQTKRIWIENPVPYMQRLNEGWSSQAPAGWIDDALRAVLAKYEKVK